MTSAPHQRRAIPRAAARPTSAYDDPNRRATLYQIAKEVLGLAERVVDELLAEAANPGLSPEERRGIAAIAVEVDRQAAARTGSPARTVEVAARGRAALGRGEVS